MNHHTSARSSIRANIKGDGYMVMEYIEGETLAARIAKVPVPLEQA